jgi:hypothetical protein
MMGPLHEENVASAFLCQSSLPVMCHRRTRFMAEMAAQEHTTTPMPGG